MSVNAPAVLHHNAGRKVLCICGSINQTSQMAEIAGELPECECYFTPHYADGLLELARRAGLLERTVLGDRLVARCLAYLEARSLRIDLRGTHHEYDLVLIPSDLTVQRNIRRRNIILVQEGMTDPEDFRYRLVRTFRFLPRWLASTAATGLSDLYHRFCVASEGYRDLFIRKGVRPEKIVVTGIPNFDNCASFLNNRFPHRHYVLACTSDARETLAHENRKAFIRRAVAIARNRQLIFKLHPNEDVRRATREIRSHAPGALVFEDGNASEMVANCDVLITHLSSTAYIGLALGKEVYSTFDLDTLRTLLPLQNASAGRNIARVCRELIGAGH